MDISLRSVYGDVDVTVADTTKCTAPEESNKSWRNWNAEWQSLTDQLLNCHEPEQQAEIASQQQRLYDEFVAAAVVLAKRIIAEQHLDEKLKTIRSITQVVGGIAGGHKYVENGIFLKVPTDTYGLYGNEENAQKAAGHELRGLMWCIDCRIEELCFPIMAIISLYGTTVVAQSLLPIGGGDTLVYGSSDGGRHIHVGQSTNAHQVPAKMHLLGSMLNLAGEYVWNSSRSERTAVPLYGGADVEVHLGRDGRLYVIDTARMFPNTCRHRDITGRIQKSFLYRMFRPEFVKSHSVPLCADAFSGFQIENKEIHQREIEEATCRLEDTVVPHFAASLRPRLEPLFKCGAHAVDHSDNTSTAYTPPVGPLANEVFETLIAEMHRAGINVRYLGSLCRHIEANDHYLARLLSTEMVARCLKHAIRGSMRSARSVREEEYKALVADWFNRIFDLENGSANGLLWTSEFFDELQRRFYVDMGDTTTTASSGTALRPDSVFMSTLFDRLSVLLGIEIDTLTAESARTQLLQIDCRHDVINRPRWRAFVLEDIAALRPTVKRIHLISFAEGTALSKMAAAAAAAERIHGNTPRGSPKTSNSLKRSSELFEQAARKYAEALRIKPDDARALYNWGLLLYHRAAAVHESRIGQSESAALALLTESSAKFERAAALEPNDHRAFVQWGNCLLQHAKWGGGDVARAYAAAACEKYQRAFEICARDYEVLFNWGNALLYMASSNDGGRKRRRTGDVVDSSEVAHMLRGAIEKYRAALAEAPKNVHVTKNLAVALSKVARLQCRHGDIAAAEKTFQEAFSVYEQLETIEGFSDWTVLFNHGNALYRAAKGLAESDAETALQRLVTSCDKYHLSVLIESAARECFPNWLKSLLLMDKLIETNPRLVGRYPVLEAGIRSYMDSVVKVESARRAVLKLPGSFAQLTSNTARATALRWVEQLYQEQCASEMNALSMSAAASAAVRTGFIPAAHRQRNHHTTSSGCAPPLNTTTMGGDTFQHTVITDNLGGGFRGETVVRTPTRPTPTTNGAA